MIKTLQSYRFIFVLFVFFSHFAWGDTPAFDFGGECGVSFFFILSGFVLSVGNGHKIDDGTFSRKGFIMKQLSKFYPLHLLTLAAFVLLSVKATGGVDVIKLLLNVFLLQSWVPDNSYNFAFNGVAWFLSDVMFFYLLFPWLYSKIIHVGVKRLFVWISIVLTAFIALASVVPGGLVNTLIYVFPPVRCIDFAVGILLYRLFRSERTLLLKRFLENRKHKIALSLVEAGIIIILLFTFIVYSFLTARVRCVALFWLFMAATIYLSAVTDNAGGALARLLHSKKTIELGGLSMEIFMVHPLVINIVKDVSVHSGIDLGYAVTAMITICLTLAAAYLLKKYFVSKLYSVLKNAVIKT